MTADKTASSLVSFFEKLITEFSWRRLFFVAGFLVLVGLCFVAYEYYTRSFMLTRLDRQAALLEKAISLDAKTLDIVDPNILGAVDGFKSRVRDVVAPEDVAVAISSAWTKTIYSLMPWALLGFVMMVASKEKSPGAIIGLLIFAVPFVILNANLPDFEPQWVSKWLIPWGEVILTIVFVLWLERYKARKAA